MKKPDNVELIHTFIACAEELHFIKAANRMGVSRSVVTKRIDKIEATVGTALFNTTTRHVELTEAGRAFLMRCYHVLPILQDFASSTYRINSAIAKRRRLPVPDSCASIVNYGHVVKEECAKIAESFNYDSWSDDPKAKHLIEIVRAQIATDIRLLLECR